MKYSKQRLATAMAATMVVSMVPAMAFAAPLDDVVDALGKEDVSKAQAGDETNAEAVLAVAKTFVKGDMKAQLLVDAYQASIDVFKATNVADWTTKKTAFDAAVAKLTFLNVNGSFKAPQTVASHAAVKAKLEVPGGMEAIDGTLVEDGLGNKVEVTLKAADAVSDVMKDGKALNAAEFDYAQDGMKLTVFLGNGVTTGDIRFKQAGKDYKVVIK